MQRKTKCDFCQYYTGSGCMATINSSYCKQAIEEYYQWLAAQKKQNERKNKRRYDDRDWND